MIFQKTRLPGVFEIHLDPHYDDRGFFARSWCQREFETHGLNAKLVQCNISFNLKKGTLRGMHFQAPPHCEAKLVRCTMGSVYDVVVDLRPQSFTFRQWIGVTLFAKSRSMVYIPEGCAHGFLTLEDETEVFYQMSEFYDAESARGVRWDDPVFQITWPFAPTIISERDRKYLDFE
ncbi:MAG TPA: dTDP-4-dehydrorhamnose 3,5-epimerase [Terracidiphilus sp.]|nr:dTDP-4-dehydrorhamnose 3,5-epimerase [Terracidiphilus sp.]